MNFTDPTFWIALVQIIGVNIVLSGDNAVVIALAARGLPADQQKRAIAWGSAAAVVMRIVLTIVAVELLRLPYLKLVGAGLLLWIAVQLLMPEEGDGGHGATVSGLGAAIKTSLLADLVMSLDNVIAVAAAAKGDITLLIIGLAISIPLVVFASRVLLTLMGRFPVIITIGAGLLGWVAGDMAVTDPVDKPWVDLEAAFLHWGAPLACAIGVVVVGKWLAARKTVAYAARTAAEAAAVAPVAAAALGSPHLQRVLLAVDGSEGAGHAVRRLLALRDDLRQGAALEVHLINVQRPLSGDVSRFVPGQTLEDYHHELGEKALAPARALLDGAGLAHRDHQRVGEPGPTIAELAREAGCDLIVMGTRGLGSHGAALLGSVAQSAVEHSSVPVLLVK
jgi:YjbE family integral membrane protein